jgi:hypothetical protein
VILILLRVRWKLGLRDPMRLWWLTTCRCDLWDLWCAFVVESLGDCETCEEVLECRWPRGGLLCGCGLAAPSSPPAIVLNPVVPSRVYPVVDCSGGFYQWGTTEVQQECVGMTVWPERATRPTPAIAEGRPGLPASLSVKRSSLRFMHIFTSQVYSFSRESTCALEHSRSACL